MTNKESNSKISRIKSKIFEMVHYCWTGIWRESNESVWIKILKTLNLSVRSFLDANLQIRSAALTFNTVLALVPALALLFAIGRGFGFQNILQEQLYNFLPSQKEAISTALTFVDSYLEHASKGVFVGVGIILLLWTLISLLGNIEKAFNNIWGVRKNRSVYRKVTDYTAIFLMIPILMICSSGVSIFMSDIVQELSGIEFVSKGVKLLFDCLPWLLSCLAFALSFFLVPNTKVRFKYALISGVICGIAFQLLQDLFVSGQIYVSKYNAIYGSFAFIPLLLIWLQMSWLILLFGCVLTYSAQNIFKFNFADDINNISDSYMRTLQIVIVAIVIKRFESQQVPLTAGEIASRYSLPLRLVSSIVDKLHDAGVVYYVILSKDEVGIAPAVDKDKFTVGDLMRRISNQGEDDFIPELSQNFGPLIQATDEIFEKGFASADDMLLKNLPVTIKP